MKIEKLVQNNGSFKLNIIRHERDVNNIVYITFNEEQKEYELDDENCLSFDISDFKYDEEASNLISFEFLRTKIDKETEEEVQYLKSLGLKKLCEEESYPELKILKKEEYYVMPFFTKHKNFRIKLGQTAKFHGKQYLEKVATVKNKSQLRFKLKTVSYPVASVKLVLLAREGLEEKVIDIDSIEKTTKSKSNFSYQIEATIDWAQYNFMDDVYDAYIDVTYECAQDFPEFTKRIRLGKTRYIRRKMVKNLYIDQENTVLSVHPYFTDKYSNISFTLQNIDMDAFNVYRHENVKQSDVILIGERPYKAQDTGFALFKQLRTNHPELPVYYVIQYDSPEYENVKPYGNTVDYGSAEHVRLTLQAKTIYCSHHFFFIYPFRHKGLENKIKARKIFIQHGVLGVKNISSLYDRSVKRFDADLFVVSSDFEKSVVERSLHYNSNEIAVTGLSRFDTLFDGKETIKNQILVIPTWRDWLSGKDKFLNSKYYEHYFNLINDEALHEKLMENDTKLVFCLHPNMQRFTPFFESKFDNVQFISQGEVNVQDLIKESKMMITDYSSVGFDFAFLDKPVVYFQFDRNRYLGKNGSFIDLDNKLPGEIVFNYDQLVDQAIKIIDSGYSVREEIIQRTKTFLKYKDLENSERILALSDAKIKTNKLERWYKQSEFLDKSFTTFRKSKHYFPTVKRMYPLMKLLPMKDDHIVFESGVGRQIADAPREIYDQLVQNDGGKYKKIWAYNGKKPLTDENTIVVKRLSPAYYYYLATSKYWVNNQSFPYYITTRKNTRYLQTWHGTPLKKMLFDLDEIHGRDDGYLGRVTQAKDQWTTLLAQSDYAEEKLRSAFDYHKEVLNVGYPRNDVLFKDTSMEEERLKRILNIPDGKKIVLYAPTFRDDAEKKGNKFSVDLQIDFEQFVENLGPDYVLLLRFHVITSNKVKIPVEYRENIKNVSNYPEIQDLYKISDCLITDYSSVFFDYINLKKPMLFYAYDLEKYEQELRGFYLDYRQDVPGPIVTTQDELFAKLSDLDQLQADYQDKIEEMLEKFAPHDDANSAQRVIDKFFNN